MAKPQVLSSQCRWNCECAEKRLLEETGACGLKDLPKEVLIKIAECLDLATQVNLWATSQHICKTLQRQICFVKDFGSTACSVPLDSRCHVEAFALCGIELLLDLPSFVQDSRVQVVYTDRISVVDTVDIWYLEDQIIPGLPDALLFQVEYSQIDGCEIHFHSDSEDQDRLLVGDLYDKRGVHRLLCTAPDPNSIPEVWRIASRVILQSSLVTGSLEDLTQCAQFCFELMCSRCWCRSALYIAIPPPDPDHDMHVGAVKIERNFSNDKDVWSVDHKDTPSPVKLDFAFFPQGASRVQAYFNSDNTGLAQPQYLLGGDLVRQQCMAFVYEGQDAA